MKTHTPARKTNDPTHLPERRRRVVIDPLIPRRRALLVALAASIQKFGFSPSTRELARAVKIPATSVVNHHLKILEREGFITAWRNEHGEMRSHTIRLTAKARAELPNLP